MWSTREASGLTPLCPKQRRRDRDFTPKEGQGQEGLARAGTEAHTEGACMHIPFHRISNVHPLSACEPLPLSCHCVPFSDWRRAEDEQAQGGSHREGTDE
jgi:hypothetical protein